MRRTFPVALGVWRIAWGLSACGCSGTIARSVADAALPLDVTVLDVAGPEVEGVPHDDGTLATDLGLEAARDEGPDTPPGDVGLTEAGLVCGGLILCMGVCRDLAADPRNCGACGRACATGQECVRGACVMAPCKGGLVACGSECVDLMTDRRHCGTCACPCYAGSVCSSGDCVTGCGAGLTSCAVPGVDDAGCSLGSVCRDLGTDRGNCGMCGAACASDEVCSMGTCVVSCRMGLTLCARLCANLQNDRANCGTCGNVCAPGQVCTDGSCRAM